MASVILLKAPPTSPHQLQGKDCNFLSLPQGPSCSAPDFLLSFISHFPSAHTRLRPDCAICHRPTLPCSLICDVFTHFSSHFSTHRTPTCPQASVQESLPLGSPHKCPTSTSTQAAVEVGSPFSPLASGPTSSPQLPGDLVIPCWDTCLSPRNKAGSQGKQWLFYLLSSCQQWGSNQSAIFSFLHFRFH